MSRMAVVVILAAASSARASSGSDVVGGSAAPPGKWPDAVAVIGDSGTCTGTLVAPDVVLTAAHCVAFAPREVVANTTDYATGKRVAVTAVTAHPDWQTSFDVAILQLAEPIDDVAPRTVATACSYAGFDSGIDVQLVGFGATGAGSNTKLFEATAPVIDPDCSGGEGCRAAIAPGGEFVAGGDGTSSCFGDSGGPVYLATARGTVVAGVVSRGIDGLAAPCSGGAIYVRVDKVMPWVEETVAPRIDQDRCTPQQSSGDDDYPEAHWGGGCASFDHVGLGAIVVALGFVVRRRPAGIRTRRPRSGQSAR